MTPGSARSRISSRSNSAMLAKMPNTSRPFAVEVFYSRVERNKLSPERVAFAYSYKHARVAEWQTLGT